MCTDQNKYLFVCGLHKSGTSLLARILGGHSDISSFVNTGFPQDEGQFLQSVFPPALKYGGPGKFGFQPEMHLTETSKLLSEENILKLRSEWHSMWDNTKMVFLEKSPPNLLKTRFLQAVFSNSYFLFILRHPVAVSYATIKWSKTSVKELLNHWITCHAIMDEDIGHLKHSKVIRYEDLIENPIETIAAILQWLGLRPEKISNEPVEDKNRIYFEKWKADRHEFAGYFMSSDAVADIEGKISRFGYSLSL